MNKDPNTAEYFQNNRNAIKEITDKMSDSEALSVLTVVLASRILMASDDPSMYRRLVEIHHNILMSFPTIADILNDMDEVDDAPTSSVKH